MLSSPFRSRRAPTPPSPAFHLQNHPQKTTTALRHRPWEASPEEAAAAGLVLGETYPPPAVDPARQIGKGPKPGGAAGGGGGGKGGGGGGGGGGKRRDGGGGGRPR